MKTIVLPAYNEAAIIGEVIASLVKVADAADEILVVDDGSTDSTASLARSAGVRVISHPYNMGNGAAVKTGLRAAKGDIVITMDADGQHSAEDISELLKHLGDYDMVVGARSSMKGPRAIANRIYNFFASYVTGISVKDLTSGFRAIRTNVARKYIYLFPNGFSYPTTITLALVKSGHSVKYVPIETRKRVGESKIRPLRDGVRFLLIITKITMLFSPLKIFVPVSSFFFVGGVLYYVYAYLTGTRFPNIPVIVILSGIMIFMMGLIAEQVAQMRLDRTESD